MAVRLPDDHWGTRSISCYEKVEQIGEGTYGQVCCNAYRMYVHTNVRRKLLVILVFALDQLNMLRATTALAADAQVYKARNKVTKGIVALKKIRVHSENFGVSFRSVTILQNITDQTTPSF